MLALMALSTVARAAPLGAHARGGLKARRSRCSPGRRAIAAAPVARVLLLPFYIAEALAAARRARAARGRRCDDARTATFVALLGWFRAESLRHRKHGPLDDA
jgi:hypothetical protein